MSTKVPKEKLYRIDVSQVFYDVDGETEIHAQTDDKGNPLPNRKTGKIEFFQFRHAMTRLMNASPSIPDSTEDMQRTLYIISCRANSAQHDKDRNGDPWMQLIEREYDLLKKIVDDNKAKGGQGQPEKVSLLPTILRNRLKDMLEEAEVVGQATEGTHERPEA